MANIHHNGNYSRKAHRLDIPILLQYKNQTYRVENWSTIGIGVICEDQSLDHLQKEEEVEVSIVLPVDQSSIGLNVTLRFKNKKGEIYGFEISKIDEKNRRALRHYATLAIEGEPDKLETLMSDLVMPVVATPIKEPILLNESEDKEIHANFKKKVMIYSAATLVVLTFAAYIFLYNYSVMYSSVGVVGGNIAKIRAPAKGLIEKEYVKRGDHVKKGMHLFDIDAADEEYLLEVERERLISLKEKYKRPPTQGRGGSSAKTVPFKKASKEETARELKRYERAQELYKEHLITLSHFNDAQRRYDAFVKRNTPPAPKRDVVIYGGGTSVAELRRNIKKSIRRTQLKIADLERKIDYKHQRAPHDATVFSVIEREHEHVEYSEPVMLLNVDETPYILTKLREEDAKNIHMNQPCIIFDITQNKKYLAHVDVMGYAAAESVVNKTVEVSEHEVPIRIVFEDQSVRLPFNQHVDVWLLHPDNAFREYVDALIWI